MLFLIISIIATAVFLFYSDPFYYNPVADFANQISGSLTEVVKGGSD